MTVPYAPGLQYDARTLVPDLTPIGGMLRDIRAGSLEGRLMQQLGQNQQAPGAPAPAQSADGAVPAVSPDAAAHQTYLDKLSHPDNLQTLARLRRLDPQAAQFVLGVAQSRDQAAMQQAKDDAEHASRTFQAFLDSKDPAEANKFLAGTIRDLESQGKDTSKLREMIGQKPDQQRLFARRQVIMAGDVGTLADKSMAALQDGLKVQGLQLDLLKKQQEMQLAASEERRKREEVAGKKDEKAQAVEAANAAARDQALTVNSQIDGVLETLGGASTGLTGSVASTLSPQGMTADKYRKLDTLKSMLAIDKLLEMKRNSPTGASGFGALSEKELAVIQNSLANLDPRQGDAALQAELAKVRGVFSDISQRAGGGVLTPRAAAPAGAREQQQTATDAERQAKLDAVLAKYRKR